MGQTFVSRTGRRMPIPTRAAYWAATRRLPREETNQTRLTGARNYFGKVFLRVVPQVRRCPSCGVSGRLKTRKSRPSRSSAFFVLLF